MKKLLIAILGCVFVLSAYAAQIVNVEYIHNAIQDKWDISLAYNSGLSEPRVAANMKYLLTAVDVANQVINGAAITDYGNGEYATMVAADTVATDTAVDELITQIQYPFSITTTSDTASFSFNISAQGKFLVDWGDGNIEVIKKPNTTNTTYSHTYDASGAYSILIGGRATAYNTSNTTAAVSFASNTNIASINGSLGQIFSTLDDGTNPRFYYTFSQNTNLTGSIPENLFSGIVGQPASYMFDNTFNACRGLTGNIPNRLFGELNGIPVPYMFRRTFAGCSGLTGSIPGDLFTGISGNYAVGMYNGLFNSCTGLTGSIPENLFGDLYGAPAGSMFASTFMWCWGLTGNIPDKLFGEISGAPATWMFDTVFYNASGLSGEIPADLFGNLSGNAAYKMFTSAFVACSKLTGPSVRINGEYMYNIWPDATSDQVGDMYQYDNKLDDYADIPEIWK